MRRLTRVLAAVAVVGTAYVATPDACAQQVPLFAGMQAARLGLGSIQGFVSDERGGPLAGAMVSALGAKNGMAVTDTRGRFMIDSLPSGVYMVRVHLPGFASVRGALFMSAPPPWGVYRARGPRPGSASSPRDSVGVGSAPAAIESSPLRRFNAANDPPVKPRSTPPAGIDLPQPEGAPAA